MAPDDSPRPSKRPVVGSRNPTARPRKVAGRGAVPPEPDEGDGSRSRLLAGSRTTLALVVALVLLIGLLVAEGIYLWGRDEPTVSAQRPVVIGEMAHRSAVDAASAAAEEIVSINYQDYDAEVEAAAARMTPEFAEQYRQTAEEIRAEFVAAKKKVEVQVVVSGVVRGSSEKVQALVFLNQYVTTDDKDTTVTPYRTVVTVEDTDSGWLVDAIETR